VHTEICYWMLAFGYCTAVLWGVMRAEPTHSVEMGEQEILRGKKRRGQGTVISRISVLLFYLVFLN
jgi:hypothetical protein